MRRKAETHPVILLYFEKDRRRDRDWNRRKHIESSGMVGMTIPLLLKLVEMGSHSLQAPDSIPPFGREGSIGALFIQTADPEPETKRERLLP